MGEQEPIDTFPNSDARYQIYDDVTPAAQEQWAQDAAEEIRRAARDVAEPDVWPDELGPHFFQGEAGDPY